MRTRRVLVMLLAFAGLTDSLAAQDQDTPSPELIVACYAAHQANSMESRCEGVGPVALAVLQEPERFPSGTVGPILDGMHALLNHPDIRVQVGAAKALVTAAHFGSAPDVSERLRRAYDEAEEPQVRGRLVDFAPDYADVAGTIVFLEHAAVDPRRTPGRAMSVQTQAVRALARMGPDGLTALAGLEGNGRVQNAQAKAQLARLSENDFRLSDGH